jgi:hypothetical protein
MSSIYDLKMIDPEENVTYEFIPGPENDDAWHIRIMAGQFNETVIKYGAIGFNQVAKDTMTFNFDIVSSPDSELTEEDLALQETAGVILQHIIKEAIEADNGTIALTEVKSAD